MHEPSQEATQGAKWYFLSIFGVDFTLMTYIWAKCYAFLLDIPVVTEEPLLFVAVLMWIFTILRRSILAYKGQSFWCIDFYKSQMALVCTVALCVFAALMWIGLFHVGVNYFAFMFLPAIFLLSSYLPIIKDEFYTNGLLRSMSIASALVAPSFFLSVNYSPIAILTHAPMYYLAILFFLCTLLRRSWMEQDEEKRERYALVVTVGLVLLVVTCLATAHTGPRYERGLNYMIITGCAMVELLTRLRRWISMETIYALSWLIFAIAPLISMYLFTYKQMIRS